MRVNFDGLVKCNVVVCPCMELVAVMTVTLTQPARV